MSEKRDLKRDLERIGDLCPVNTFVAREAINRAIEAESEVERLKTELNEIYLDDFGTVWNRPTAEAYYRVCKARDKWQEWAGRAEADAITMVEENDIQRQAIQNLSAQVATYRNALQKIHEHEEYAKDWTNGMSSAGQIAMQALQGGDTP